MKYLLGNQEINIIVKNKNIKNMYFRIDDDNNLIITCPRLFPDHKIKSSIEDNKEALLKMYNKTKEKNKDNDKFKYLGKTYNIIYLINLEKVGFKDENVYTPSKEALDSFWKTECLKVFTGEINICRKCFNNLPEFRLKIRKMKTRWGVCNPRDKIITLNSELLKKDLDLIDYVIIHEMCHFYEANHSPEFWDLVKLAYPKYKEARKKLKE